MTPDELRAIMDYLRARVQLDENGTVDSIAVNFNAPTADEMIAAGLNAQAARDIRSASWWEEMVADIIETPDFCEPDDPPQQVLEYARDVVSDYIRKRVPLK